MSLSDIIFKNQKIFKGSTDVKYFYWEPKTKSDYLVVTFSGFNGKEEFGEPAYYNYVRQLEDFDCHRLFILDNYEGIPVYYLGTECKLDYEASVIAIIERISNNLNIPKSNIITSGSSKGGTAALYFGTKYKYGHIISAGMQVKVGDYLFNLSSYTRYVVLNKIAGGYDEKARDYLNNYFLEVFKEVDSDTTNINIHIGKGDHHYDDHLKHLLNIYDAQNINYNLEVKDYNEHSGLAIHFPPFLTEQLTKIIS